MLQVRGEGGTAGRRKCWPGRLVDVPDTDGAAVTGRRRCFLQGDLLKQVAAFLGAEYGIPPALMELKSKAK